MKWLAAVVLLVGCDEVFSVDHVDLAIDAPRADVISEPCPTFGYGIVAGAPEHSTYKYVKPSGIPWDSAELECESDSITKITHLVVFDDPSEEAAVRAVVQPAQSFWQVFVGYARSSTANGGAPFNFTAVTGEPLDISSPIWEKVNGPEPDNGGTGSEETITFFEATRNMSDARADITLGYICECDGKPANHAFQIR